MLVKTDVVTHSFFNFSLPRVSFKGEIGVDYGGIKREFFTIAIKEIITKTNLLGTCANGRMVWFTGLGSDTGGTGGTSGEIASNAVDASPRSHKQARLSDADGSVGPTLVDLPSGSVKRSAAKYEQLSLARPLAYYLGLLVGLAAYNEVHVDVPLPPCIYKTIKGEQVSRLGRVVLCSSCLNRCCCLSDSQLTLMDLWGADSALASGLQALLDFEEGTGCIEEVFGVTFTASANPLLGFVQSAASYNALSRQASVASDGGDGESTKVRTGSHVTQVRTKQ